MKLNRKMFLCGDMVQVYKCDQCERESDKGGGWPGNIHWEKQNFSLCLECLEETAREHIFGLEEESIDGLYSKKPIPPDIRWQVWERDNFTCQDCGSRKKLEVDHIYPESKGGVLELSNLQTLCKSCNSRKGTRTK